jgi:hypothetical protein
MDDYRLPLHVHCCQRGDAFVFLDLKQDDYTLVSGPAADALRALTHRDPNPRSMSADDPLVELAQGGLLTKAHATARPFAPTDVDPAIESLLDPDEPGASTPRFAQWLNFMIACTTAAARLRWHPIERTVTEVARRKAVRAARLPLDVDQARELTAVFHRLRRLFPANYLCLFDSLALLEFLARYDVFPTWVFGVRLEPWTAHCWIQHGPFAFNECVEEAASYTPIMAI